MRIFLLVALLLTGCASTTWIDSFNSSLRQGRCSDAMNVVESANIPAIDLMVAKGAVYNQCYRDTDKAAAYFSLAARYGNPAAIDELIKMGKPIPAADLAQQQYSRPQYQPPQQQQRQPVYSAPRNTQTTCGWQGNQWVCNSQPTGIDASIYNNVNR